MRAKVCIRGRDAELGMFAGASSCCRLGGSMVVGALGWRES